MAQQGLSNLLLKELTREELKKFFLLAAMLLTTIFSYWVLKSLKDAIFIGLVGITYQPTAKILSLIFIFPFILLYSKLADWLPKHRLFYLYGTFYFILFLTIALLLKNPTLGLTNTEASPYRALGWISYIGIESFGSLMVALFWSFTTSVSTTKIAKKCYPIIVFIAQFGAIFGPTLVIYSDQLGITNLYLVGSLGSLLLIILTYLVMDSVDFKGELREHKRKNTSAFEGLRLILKDRYVLGILVVSTFHEVVGTILDYEMKFAASQAYPRVEDFAIFMGRFGQAIHGFSFLFALLGSTILLNRFGLYFSLVLYPALSVGIVLLTSLYPSIQVFFVGMVAYKVLNYALNNPTKEIVYIPTTEDIRYKSKAWIDVFGQRFTKGVGSGFITIFKDSFDLVIKWGGLFSLVVLFFWILGARYVGRTFDRQQAENI